MNYNNLISFISATATAAATSTGSNINATITIAVTTSGNTLGNFQSCILFDDDLNSIWYCVNERVYVTLPF